MLRLTVTFVRFMHLLRVLEISIETDLTLLIMKHINLILILVLFNSLTIQSKLFSQEKIYRSVNSKEIDERISRVENGLQLANIIKDKAIPTYSLEERMKYYNVPGLSIAVINNNKIEWAKSYGLKEMETNDSVSINTIFRIASLSKPVSALVADKLDQLNQIDLDKPFNDQLLKWKIPENEFTRKEAVTPKMLILHTSGTDIFSKNSSESYKNLQTLFKLPYKSDTLDIVVITNKVPGTEWKYTNGEYVMLQELIEEKSDLSLNQAASKYIFNPLGMDNSFYDQYIPENQKINAAKGHDVNGKCLKDPYCYIPTIAAGGLWSTPLDYANLLIELQKSANGKSELLFTQDKMEEIFSRYYEDMGLAFLMKGDNDDLAFTHNGGVPGYCADAFAFVYQGKGAVIMANSDRGLPLILELYRSLASEYNWSNVDSHFKQDTISIVDIDRKELTKFEGIYSAFLPGGAKIDISIKAKNNYLIMKTMTYSYKLYPIGNNEFKSLEFGDLEFELTNNKVVNGFEYLFEFGFGEATRK